MSRQRLQRGLALAAVLLGLGGMLWLNFATDVEWKPESLRDAVRALGIFGPLALIGIMTFRPFLFLPSWLVMMAAGMLFGPYLGTAYSAFGGALGGALIFGIARALGRETVQSYLGVGSMRAFEEFLAARGTPWLALYTAIPISVLTPVFAGAGLSRLSFGKFMTATGVGFVPRAGLFAVAGRAAAEPTLRNVVLAVGLIVVAIAGTWFARRWLSARPS